MNDSVPIFGNLIAGFSAFTRGIRGSMSCREIRSSYFWFTLICLVITILGYFIVSFTMISALFMPCLLFLGPIFGPFAFAFFSYIFLTTMIILWLFGKFPWPLFFGSFGVLRPLLSVPHVSFLLTLILIPISCDEFMLAGVERISQKEMNPVSNGTVIHSNKMDNPIFKNYKKPGFKKTFWLFICNTGMSILLKSLCFTLIAILKLPSWIEYIFTSFLLGSQLVSVYSVRIRSLSFKSHLDWCWKNMSRIIGFTLPFCVIQNRSWIASFVWLGIIYYSASFLVEEMVVDDLRRHKIQ